MFFYAAFRNCWCLSETTYWTFLLECPDFSLTKCYLLLYCRTENNHCNLKPRSFFIIENLRLVDKCFLSVDKDRTVIDSIKMIFDKFGNQYNLAFANGGDQNNDTIPERTICEELGIELVDGLGSKIQSSSWLLNK